MIAIKVRADTRRVENRLSNISLRVPKEIGEGGYEFCKAVQKSIRIRLAMGGHIWRRKLYESVKAQRMSKNVSVLKMAAHGVFLDQMTPHRVQLKRGRLIWRWAMQKGNAAVQAIAARQGIIWVRPHPFFDAAYTNSLIKLRPILARRLKRGVGG